MDIQSTLTLALTGTQQITVVGISNLLLKDQPNVEWPQIAYKPKNICLNIILCNIHICMYTILIYYNKHNILYKRYYTKNRIRIQNITSIPKKIQYTTKNHLSYTHTKIQYSPYTQTQNKIPIPKKNTNYDKKITNLQNIQPVPKPKYNTYTQNQKLVK